MRAAPVSAPKRRSVFARLSRSTVLARAAVAGLTLGLSALAVLAVFGTARTSETATWVRSADQITESWSRTFVALTLEEEMLGDYLAGDPDTARAPLVSSIGSARPHLEWLARNGSAEDREAARSVQEGYRSYSELLGGLAAAEPTRGPAERAAEATLIGRASSSLQKQVVAQMSRKRLITYEYLTEVEIQTERVRLAAVGLGLVDLLLLAFCALVLLGHQRHVEQQAVRDGLTGLANRALLTKRMQRALRAADRRNELVGLLMIDLNKFKEVNDTLGHHAGDLLLQHVADRLTQAVRDVDTVARLGGDEFAVLLPRVRSAPSVAELTGRMLTALQGPADLDGVVVDVHASIGAAVYPLHAADATELARHADDAMYQAKRGRLGCVLYHPGSAEPGSDARVLSPS